MKFNKNNRFMIVAAIFIVIIIIFSGFYYIVFYFGTDAEEIEMETEFEIDDQVSPYTNQGLIFEMLRMRHRGLMELMLLRLGPGKDWENPPSYYYTATVDGKEGNVAGNVGENGLFNVWDNIGNENLISYFIEEEQKRSEITISIIERVNSGLLGLNTQDIEQEIIKLSYDYRTGRWFGDDSLNDNDGYGHYIGDTFEIWFNIYQSDYDHDGIPYWIEKNVLKTNPIDDDRNNDPDLDGIPTSWEWKWEYDPFTWDDHYNLDPDIDGIENIEEYQMREFFANPYQPEIYIETDGMEKGGIFDLAPHIFPMESQQMIIERFAQHGIWIYIDDGGDFWKNGPLNGGGEFVPYHKYLDDVEGKECLSFYKHYFADERKGIFRYIVMGNEGGFNNPVSYNMFDMIVVGSGLKDSLLFRRTFSPRAYKVGIAKVALHELGHSLGLVPTTYPGNDIMKGAKRYPSMPNEEYNSYLNDYYSVMNYNYIYNDRTLFDYSHGNNGAPYDQDDWTHLYLPTHQVDLTSYEEPTDESFEDFEVVEDYPGVVLDGWENNDNLTEDFYTMLKELANVKNTGVEIQTYAKIEISNETNRNIRIYAIPKVYPTHAVWSLIAEGYLDSENNINLYSQKEMINEIHPMN
jgi:hypothetical protein